MYTTNNKLILLNLFNKDKNKSYTGPQLIELLNDKMNKATIYRLLIKLEKNNEIIKFYNNNLNCYEYQLFQDCNKHIHLKCKKCGKIIHLKCDESNNFLYHLQNEHNFFIDKEESIILGYCKECK